MIKPDNATEVFQFLGELLDKSRQAGDAPTSAKLEYARHFLTPAVTSEFMEEAIVALLAIAATRPPEFSSQDLKTISQLASAIERRWFGPNLGRSGSESKQVKK